MISKRGYAYVATVDVDFGPFPMTLEFLCSDSNSSIINLLLAQDFAGEANSGPLELTEVPDTLDASLIGEPPCALYLRYLLQLGL